MKCDETSQKEHSALTCYREDGGSSRFPCNVWCHDQQNTRSH